MSRMTRSIVSALAAAALLSSFAATAQTAVLYGLVDASGSRVKPLGGGESRLQLDNGNMTRSFLGLRGSEDLGGGLRAVYKLESYLRVDTGGAGRNDSDAFFGREASAGLSGAFGTTVLGRTPTPLWLSTIFFNPFGESIGFSPATRHYFGASGAVLGDTRWNNSISYMNNPRDAPLRIHFAANADETTGAASTGPNLGLSASYLTGPFAATVAVERIKNSPLALPTGFVHQTAVQAGATYDFSFVRVYGQFGRVTIDADLNSRTTIYQLGLAVPIGTSLILASYGRSHTSTRLAGSTDRTAAVGYDYFLSKNTDIYLAALYEKLSSVSSGSTIAGGVRLRF